MRQSLFFDKVTGLRSFSQTTSWRLLLNSRNNLLSITYSESKNILLRITYSDSRNTLLRITHVPSIARHYSV